MKNIGTQTIETKRLLLRKTIDSDAEPMFYNWANDRRVTKYLIWPPYESVQQLKDSYHKYLLEHADDPEFYDWKIVLKELKEPIGSIGVVNNQPEIEEVEIGYCIGCRWWHKGIMTEALAAVIKYLFEEVGVNRIMAHHDINNPHSGDVMKKCGLQYEGTRRQGGKNMQGICDIACYAILKKDYYKDC